jgi:hypothetical protein
MTNYAEFAVRSASLASDFGGEFAAKYFAADVLAKLPVYVRGPKKGKLKGEIEWTRCTRGGWVRGTGWGGEGYAENRVGRIIEIRLIGPGSYHVRLGMMPGPVIARVDPTDMPRQDAA